MKGISHKQAVNLIHLRLDGLLKESQSLSLDAHLDSCDSCRSYATEMDALPVHLQNEFHVRWDRNGGPSYKVLEHVTTKARKIPMTNRISSSIRLMASAFLVAFLILGINFMILQMKSTPIDTIGTQSVSGSELRDNGLIAFTFDQDSNAEIYTMHADGTNMTNLTNLSAHDVNPVWSPDGKRIAFESDRTGFIQIYTMNPDGSNLMQITNEEADHAIGTEYGDTPEPWSPDGKKIIFSQTVRGDENRMLYVMDADGNNKIALTDEFGSYTFLGWSPDGQKIVYQTPNLGHNAESRIMIANVDGTSTMDGIVGKDFGISSQIQWEGPDQLVLLASNSNVEPPNWQLSRMFVTTDTSVYNGFGPTIADSSVPIVALFQNTYVAEDQDALRWFAFNGRPIPTSPWNFPTVCEKPLSDPFMPDTFHSVSPDRNHAIVVVFCGEGAHLYLENADGTQINQLGTPIPEQSQVNELTWSPDGKYMIVTISTDNITNLFRFDVQEMLNNPSTKPVQLTTDDAWKYGVVWQPIASNEITEKESTPEPSQTSSVDSLIAFTADNNDATNTNTDIYTMHLDGSHVTNLTHDPTADFNANDYGPIWSPDGTQLAFISDRMGQPEIFVMNMDGSNIVQLTDVPNTASWWEPMSWSPDGQSLVASHIPTEMAWVDKGQVNLYVINADGSGATQITTNEVGNDTNPKWSPDGKFIAFVRTAYTQAGIYSVQPNRSNLTALVLNIGNEGIFDWSPDGQVYYLSTDVPCWTSDCILADKIGTINTDGTNQKSLFTFQLREPSCTSGHLNTSPDGSRLLISFPIGCIGEGQIFIMNSDGSNFKNLVNLKPGWRISQVHWSPDGKFVVFVGGQGANQDIYILDVDRALQNPSTQPVRLMDNANSPVWRSNP